MERRNTCKSFITEARIAAAARHAEMLASEHPLFGAYDCAEDAVRNVFGHWITAPDGTVRADRLPLYFQLINRVESRLGLHRSLRFAGRNRVLSGHAGLSEPVFQPADEFIGATPIAI